MVRLSIVSYGCVKKNLKGSLFLTYNFDMPKKQQPCKKQHQIALRLDDDQMERLNRVFSLGDERTLGQVDHSVMLRELLGLTPLKILTEEDRHLLLENGESKIQNVKKRKLALAHHMKPENK